MFATVAYCAVVAAFRDNHPGGVRFEFALDDGAYREARAVELVAEMERVLADHRVPGKVAAGPFGLAIRLDDPVRLGDVELDLAAIADSQRCTTIATACFRVRDLTDAQLRAVLEHALGPIRDRVGEKGSETSVVIEGNRIVVEIAGDREIAVEMAELVERRASLEMKVADDCSISAPCTAQVPDHTGSPFMKLVYAHVGRDPAASAAGITADIDQWRPEGGPAHTDYYLRAADREEEVTPDEAKQIGCFDTTAPDKRRCTITGRRAIERYLAGLAAASSAFQVPDDREIGFERAEPAPDAKDSRPFWRTYYLVRPSRLTGAAVAKATPSYDANTNRPVVMLDLTRTGGQAFGELTTEIVGMKLATLLDGKIKSAPIVNGPIRGGRVSITMGGGDPARAEREAHDLAAVLSAGAMPALREESAREFPGLTGMAWPKLVPGLTVLLGLIGFAVVRRRAA
jgi:preprotein translocase subunit SecD